MNNKKSIIILVISAAVVFIVLAGFLFINSYLNNRNVVLRINNNTSTPPAVESQNNPVAATSSTPGGSEYQAQVPGDTSQFKELVKKEIENNRKTPAKTISDVYKTVDECAALKTVAGKDLCVSLWAESKNDPSICQRASESARQGCRDGVYAQQASAAKNMSLCSGIKSPEVKRSCIFKLIETGGITEKDCSSLAVDDSKLCLSQLTTSKAVSVKDCDNISDSAIKDVCRRNFYADLVKN